MKLSILFGITLTASAAAFVQNNVQRSPFVQSRRGRRFGMPTFLRYTNSSQVDMLLTRPISRLSRHRDNLKNELAVASIENYDIEAYNSGMTTIAEDLMKKLEPLRPWTRPAHREEMNARWSFVFTGVPTVGMKLITLLSRISVVFPIVDFQDVFLEVYNKQRNVKAIVSCNLFGVPVELNVFTSLRPNVTCPEGTMLIEQFEGLEVAGVKVPTPDSWHSARSLEISYLDEDMMIARTAGGEPHLLLRHSPCSTDDETCNIDNELTSFFQSASEKYGKQITRCLVDRSYGQDIHEESGSSATAQNDSPNIHLLAP